MPYLFRLISLTGLLLLSLLSVTTASAAYEDPSDRVARLPPTQGEVSYSPAGEDNWFGVVLNRP